MKYLNMLSGIGIFLAGVAFPAWWALALLGLCGAVQGALFARAEQGSTLPTITSVGHYPLELGSLTDQLGANGLMPLYIQTEAGYQPVLNGFIARLDNQRAIVLGTS